MATGKTQEVLQRMGSADGYLGFAYAPSSDSRHLLRLPPEEFAAETSAFVAGGATRIALAKIVSRLDGYFRGVAIRWPSDCEYRRDCERAVERSVDNLVYYITSSNSMGGT